MATKVDSLKSKFKTVLETINKYPDQLQQAWNEVGNLIIPEEYKNIKNVVFCGMGGSALGARMVDSLCEDRLKVPFEIYTGYKLPDYTFHETLVIASSYSGNTEETVTCAHLAFDRGAKLFGISTGGKLTSFLQEKNVASYIFRPVNNPSKQPRMSIGYASGALLSLLSKIGVLNVTDEEIKATSEHMKSSFKKYSKSDSDVNKLARLFKDKAPILVASEHLVGTAHTIKNHFNESAKTFSALFDLPELNHHLMEGLKNPHKLKTFMHFLFLNSNLYSDRVKKRYPLTQEVVVKNGYKYSEFTPNASTKIEQVYETLVFGSLLVYYLSKNYNIDPTTIPWVDYFKEKLSSK